MAFDHQQKLPLASSLGVCWLNRPSAPRRSFLFYPRRDRSFFGLHLIIATALFCLFHTFMTGPLLVGPIRTPSVEDVLLGLLGGTPPKTGGRGMGSLPFGHLTMLVRAKPRVIAHQILDSWVFVWSRSPLELFTEDLCGR